MFDLHKKSHPNDEIVGWWVHVLLMISSRLFTWCHRLENSPLDCRILLLNVNHLRFFLNLKSFFFLFLLINNFYFYFFFFLTIWICSIVFEVDYKMYGELRVWLREILVKMYLAIDIELLVKDIKNRYTVVNAKFWKHWHLQVSWKSMTACCNHSGSMRKQYYLSE